MRTTTELHLRINVSKNCIDQPRLFTRIRKLTDQFESTEWTSTDRLANTDVRPFDRQAGPRGYKTVRKLGRYKVDESQFQKL